MAQVGQLGPKVGSHVALRAAFGGAENAGHENARHELHEMQ